MTSLIHKCPPFQAAVGAGLRTKEISNNSGLFGLVLLFVAPGVGAGLILVVLGFTQAIEPFLLTNYRYGLVVEGAALAISGAIGGLTTSLSIGLLTKSPVKFVIDEKYIQSVMPGGLISKSSSFIERHPREGITSIELEEVVSHDDEGGKSVTYSAKLIGFYGTNVGTIRGITTTGIAEEIAETIDVEIVRRFD